MPVVAHRSMRAMVIDAPGRNLRAASMAIPVPGANELLLRVRACAVCRTDLHIIDGDLLAPEYPRVPGHEIVADVVDRGAAASGFPVGSRVGVPWLGWTCGTCEYCLNDRENLCDNARFTGFDADGGFAEYVVADHRFCFPIPAGFSDTQAAPLLCAGMIGHRSLRMAGAARRIGVYGFGAAAHILAQVARHEGREVYAFTRPGDNAGQSFARSLGAVWAGDSDSLPPERLDAAIIFAPVGALVPVALRSLRKGGVVVCGGIHMSAIPEFEYDILWGERSIRSVANLTRDDALAFLRIAAEVPVRCDVRTYALEQANEALDDVRNGRIHGAAVLVPAIA